MSPRARVVACVRGRYAPATAAAAYVKGRGGAMGVGLGRDWFLAVSLISEAATAASTAASVRC